MWDVAGREDGLLQRWGEAERGRRRTPTMPELRPATLQEHFAELTDPRVDRGKLHLLLDILLIALCAVLCGADTWVEIEAYGRAKEEGLKQFLA